MENKQSKSSNASGDKQFPNLDADPHNQDWIRNRTDDSNEALGLESSQWDNS